MSGQQMHADEVHIDVDLVGRLLGAQFPEWAKLPIEPVPSAGTDNALYRLGNALVVRLPRIHSAVEQVGEEHLWLPRLAPLLPMAIPVPLGKGEPAEGYPWPWSVYRWLKGENATIGRIADPSQLATDLAHFVTSLQRVEPTNGPPAVRGIPLELRDPFTRSALAALRDHIDVDAATEAWEAALEAPNWHGPPVWIHGDLHSGNLLAAEGRLSAVIDFGGLGVGDPAGDLMVAWTLLPAEARGAFRAAIQANDATWVRGRGGALSFALVALPYYRDSNPEFARIAQHTIEAVLADLDA